MVPAVVTERQLVGAPAEREPEDLVAEADAEDRHRAHQPTHRVDGPGDGGGIAGTVGEEDTVRVACEDVGGGRRRRNHFDATTRRRPGAAGSCA